MSTGPNVVNTVTRGAQGLSAFAVWKIQQGRPTAVEQDFWNYLASLAGGGSGAVQQRFAINGVAQFKANHSLPGRPNVTILKPDGTQVYTDTVYADNLVTLTFPQPFTGVLYLG